jgi:hypothetical protein
MSLEGIPDNPRLDLLRFYAQTGSKNASWHTMPVQEDLQVAALLQAAMQALYSAAQKGCKGLQLVFRASLTGAESPALDILTPDIL